MGISIRKVTKKQSETKANPIFLMGTSACFTFTTANVIVLNPQKFSGNSSSLCSNTLCLAFLSSKPHNLPFSHSSSSNLRSSVKLASFSMGRATHLRVSQDALSPTEESHSSSHPVIGEHDLLIVGPGVLGRLVAQKWREVLFHFSFFSVFAVY